MRLIHVIEGLSPDRGGPPVVCSALAAAQARLGHDVTVVCEERGSAPGPTDQLVHSMRGGERLTIERVAKQTLFDGLYADLRKSARALRRRADLFHIHGVWNPIALAASRAARRELSPYVLSSHGALHPSCMAEGAVKKRTALAMGWRRLLAEARRVLCLNEEEAAECDRLAKAAVATIVPNGIDFEAIPVTKPNLFRSAHTALDDRPYFVFVGRLDRVKGLDQLLAAFAAYRALGGACDLVLIGPDWGQRSEIEALIDAPALHGRVHLIGPLYDERKIAALREALAFVHRPRYEGFGLAVVEAMAVGTPAVIGDRCLLPTRGESDGIIVVGGDDNAFAQALLRIERDAALRATLSSNAIACVRRQFDWSAIAQATLEVAGLGDRT